ncbi:glutathione S-transferase family protein [Wenxinia saemankumensis]|uniref:Glutathione S-transferase n=1 Tax=Wenxinia saemankumensis TaxID=1447782 RepID=A0A1M6CV75_9RHOB|nr:glutathione S-transferase family protein [Wenxinia saemankumensis]SHI64927.1 glutathione S-transferase [Wenxinia saemankumensis]
MPDYVLYYWPLPFRGQFVRAALAEIGAPAREPGPEAVSERMGARPADQDMPHMGPPLLVDGETGEAVSQMPAILLWLGLRHDLLPEGTHATAAALKVVADSNDVIDEITRQGGMKMWDDADWAAFAEERLPRWMAIFEATGARGGLTGEGGWMSGTGGPGVADIATFVCWHTMTDRLPELRPLLERHAPKVAALCDRMAARPAQADLIEATRQRFGNGYCGGQIEKSLRGAVTRWAAAKG